MKAANGVILFPRATDAMKMYSNPGGVDSLCSLLYHLSLSVSKMQCACSSVGMTINKKISEEENRCLKEKILILILYNLNNFANH